MWYTLLRALKLKHERYLSVSPYLPRHRIGPIIKAQIRLNTLSTLINLLNLNNRIVGIVSLYLG